MVTAPENLVGMSIEWTGVHHSDHGDFHDISTHTVTYETEDVFFVTARGKLVGEGSYVYRRIDEQMAIDIYHPREYQGRKDVVLHAIFDFAAGKDRAVLFDNGKPFAVADGDMREVPRRQRPLG